MPSSERSFETRANRFANANTLVQGWGDYNSTNPLTTKAEMNAFESIVIAANADVDAKLLLLDVPRGNRRPLCFKIKDTNPVCLELRIIAIDSYLKSEFGADSPSAKTLKRVISRIRPRYENPDPNTHGEGRSPSEKSFASLVGLGDIVVATIQALGVAYAPTDPNLSVANMQALVNQIRQLNKDVVIALEPYGTSNRVRRKLFDNKMEGMNKRITIVKNYLASFPGLKKSDHYIEFSQAIKGT